MTRILALAVALMLASCTNAAEDAPTVSTQSDQAVAGVGETTGSIEDSATTTVLPSVTATTPIDLAAVFLLVVEEAMEATEFEGYAEEFPEDILVIGQAFCEMRDAGHTDEEAMTEYLLNLAEHREVEEIDAVFAGTVMGAAFETLCPTTE